MASIIVTGSNGQVGSELRALAKAYPHFQFHFTGVKELDITQAEKVETFFAQHQPTYCINCAAYTAVDKAETEKELAQQINVLGAQYLAQACAKYHTQFFHLSTDYVYHNQQNTPFKEEDPTHPQSVYAHTKLAGDDIALREHPQTMVLRTSWVYSSFGHNFVKTMIRLGTEREELGIVFDQIGTPTYARDLAAAILQLIQQKENGQLSEEQLKGIFHYSNEGVSSWYDFALAIFELENITCRVKPIETTAYPTPASRPPFSVLNKHKFTSTFGITIPHWRESLKACLATLKNTSQA